MKKKTKFNNIKKIHLKVQITLLFGTVIELNSKKTYFLKTKRASLIK